MNNKYTMNGGENCKLNKLYSSINDPMEITNNDRKITKFGGTLKSLETNQFSKQDINGNLHICTSNMCAPSKKFTEGSCISLETLIKMTEAYNTYSKKNKLDDEIKLSKGKLEMLKPQTYKKYLLREFSKRLNEVCNDQICWTKQDFVKYMRDEMAEDLLKKTFKPIGPQGKFTWLNTINITEVMEQYEEYYKDYIFLGAVPVDFDDLPSLGIVNLNLDKLSENGKTKLGIIFNLDEHYKSGSHWVGGYCDINDGKIYYYDSYGTYPDHRINKFFIRILNYCKKKNPNVVALYNKRRHQYKNSECGVYSISFILNLLKGKSFFDIVGNDYPDDNVNLCRKKYFYIE